VLDDSCIFIGRHRSSAAHITINGELMTSQTFVVLPPGGHFVFSVDMSRTWFAISLPRAMVEAHCFKNDDLKIRWTERRPYLLPLTLDQNTKLVARAERMHALSSKGACDAAIEAAEAELLVTARHLLSNGTSEQTQQLDKVALKANDTVARALSSLENDAIGDDWYVEDMAEAAQVHPRTLLRAFQRVIGMGPVRYLRLRQLNLIRQQLYRAADDRLTVTRIMQEAGASDLGRVSGSYKLLFGETPSETLRAALAAHKGKMKQQVD
jgi:AraC family ethanolamine operon transcriptional activator